MNVGRFVTRCHTIISIHKHTALTFLHELTDFFTVKQFQNLIGTVLQFWQQFVFNDRFAQFTTVLTGINHYRIQPVGHQKHVLKIAFRISLQQTFHRCHLCIIQIFQSLNEQIQPKNIRRKLLFTQLRRQIHVPKIINLKRDSSGFRWNL